MICHLIILPLVVGCSSASAANAQLLLVRNATSEATCDDVVFHGRLFAVPARTDFESLGSTLGLKLLTHV